MSVSPDLLNQAADELKAPMPSNLFQESAEAYRRISNALILLLQVAAAHAALPKGPTHENPQPGGSASGIAKPSTGG